MKLETFRSKLFLFLFLSLLLKPVWLFDISNLGTSGDDLSYWLHASTIAFDFDINYVNDHNFASNTFDKNTKAPLHNPGSGYIASIFVLVFNYIDKFIGNDIDRLMPIGSFAYVGFFGSSLIQTFFGFVLLNKLFLIKKIDKNKFPILFLTFLSTLVHYSFTRFLMSHSTEFLLSCCLIYLFERKDLLSTRDMYFIASVFFMMSITRPSTFIISLCLIPIYFKKMRNAIELKSVYVVFVFSLLYLHYFISINLYSSPTLFFDIFQRNTTSIVLNELSILSIFNNVFLFPNLLFSPSGGVLFTTPLILLGLIAFFYNTYLMRKNGIIFLLFSILYVLGFFIVVIVWAGIESSYGQRLLIGLLPYFALQISQVPEFKYQKFTILILIVSSYTHYIYLYSSSTLTMFEGISLWGTKLKYSQYNYSINLFNQLFDLNNILSILVKTIYSINIFGLIEFEKIMTILPLKLSSNENLNLLQSRADIYYKLNYGYIFVITLLYSIFNLQLIKIFSSKRKI